MEISKRLNEKQLELNISVEVVGRLLNLNPNNIAKWKKGTTPSKYEDVIRLKSFIRGDYDQFVIHGKLITNYNHQKAIEKIFPPNPTNDTYENFRLNNVEDLSLLTVQEPPSPYGVNVNALNTIITYQIKEIGQLRSELEKCLQQKIMVNDIQKTA